jgi:VanZ family protein
VFGRIFVITVVLIVYGSLYPFAFESRHLAAAPFTVLAHSWPSGVDRFLLKDFVLNVLIYLPVGFFGVLALGKGQPRIFYGAVTVLLGLALSTGMEALQLYDDARNSSALDVVSNTLGSTLGAGLAFLYGKRVARMLEHPQMRAVFRPSGALLLLCCWIGYQTFPLIPQLSHTQLFSKLAFLLHPASFSPLQFLDVLVSWLIVARLLEAVGGPGTLAWMMLLIPARLFLNGRTVTWADIGGGFCAWLLWSRLLCRQEKRTILLAFLAAALLVVRGTVPFHWQSMSTPFSWVPFAGFLTEQSSVGMIFFYKTFLYGTTLWLFRASGYPDLVTIAGVALLLGLVEASQTHLVDRTPEITDSFYTVILGLVLRFLDSADRQARAAAERQAAVVRPGG